MDADKLKKVLDSHARWLRIDGGTRADLRGADLGGADLRKADLWGADLREANLRGADLGEANLTGANLREADLGGADLRGAHLGGADLRKADLGGADLWGANLRRADLREANLPHFQLPGGDLVVWKKAARPKSRASVIVKLLVRDDVKRTASLVGRKCRSESAEVLWISDGAKVALSSTHHVAVEYRVGETVHADNYDDNPAVECSGGIHWFQTRAEAEEW